MKMKKQSENDFKKKFSLLNSQQNSDEIIWTCSESSDYENKSEGFRNVNKTINRKRKRRKTRKKTSTNISNLDITFVQASAEYKCEKYSKGSIFQNVEVNPSSNSTFSCASVNDKNEIISDSPILSTNTKNCNHIEKSPILLPNYASPKISPNVRKKLFNSNINKCTTKKIESHDSKIELKEIGRSKSPVLNCSPINKQSRYNSKQCYNVFDKNLRKNITNTNQEQSVQTAFNKQIIIDDDVQIENRQDKISFDDTLTVKTTSVALLEKVKSYFDSHFSSEKPSQQSISEYDTTPKNSSKNSEEIEFVTSQNDTKPVPRIIKLEKASSSDSLSLECDHIEKSKKKIRYKKGGLSYRLSDLLKKQKANICLWEHERFLAANSNFILPHDEFAPFHIQNVTFKYGCHLLEVVDMGCQKYIVIVNHLNMSNFKEQMTIFKLYKPYKIIDFNDEYKIIVNVCKFECT